MKAILFMPNASVTERLAELKKVCATQKVDVFKRTLTDSDVEKECFDYSTNGGKLRRLKDEAKEVANEYKEKVSAVEKEMELQLDRIETGKREVSDELYGVANYKTGQMEFFDKYGELIDTRKLTPDEFHGKLFDNDGDAANTTENENIAIGYDAPEKTSDIEDADFEEVTDKKDDAEPSSETKSDDVDEKTSERPKKTRKNKKPSSNTETE